MPELPKDAYVLEESAHRKIFEERILPQKFAGLRSVSQPIAYFVGAQPGAGKSRIQRRLRTMLEDMEGPGSVMEIVGDDLRMYHPKYEELLLKHDERAAFFTDIDSGKWVALAIEASQRIRAHVILEGTLRRPEITRASARSYRRAGFRTELHVLAVHEFQSRLYVIGRYLGQVEDKGYGRYTIRTAHDEAYAHVPESLAVFAKVHVFDHMVVYNADADTIAEGSLGTKGAMKKLRDTFAKERRAPRMSTEEMLKHIDSYLRLAERYGKKECYQDLLALRRDILSSTFS